jgi:AraC-like DNA-binding protein
VAKALRFGKNGDICISITYCLNILNLNIIAWIGFSQGIFAALLMFAKRDNSVSDKILSAWLTLLAIEFMTCGLDYIIFNEPLLSSSFLLFNPALFLYVKSLTVPDFRLRFVQLLHLLPFVVFELFAYLLNEPFNLQHFFTHDDNYVFRMIFSFANFVSWLVYIPSAIMYVHKHRMHLRNEQSSIDKNENLGWVLFVSVFYVVYCILSLLLTIIVYYGDFYLLFPHVFNYSALLFIVYVLGFYGLYQRKLPQVLLVAKSVKMPYQNSTLSDETKESISKILVEYVEARKAYLNPQLSMDMLSAEIRIPKYQITEVLNMVIGQNFFRFINSYRIEAVKQMLADPKNHFSIEAIGFECGFASKTAFYSVFKNFTGLTPLAYRESLRKN